MLTEVWSGFQDGADIASIRAAQRARLQVGGWIPHGYRTLSGPHQEYATLYNAQEHESPDWSPRTRSSSPKPATTRLRMTLISCSRKCGG